MGVSMEGRVQSWGRREWAGQAESPGSQHPIGREVSSPLLSPAPVVPTLSFLFSSHLGEFFP